MHSRGCRASVVCSFAVIATAVLFGGCVASAQFHSKTGQAFPRIAARGVLCTEPEAHAVMAAGAIVIGTISGQGLTTTSSEADVADKAAQVAAENGGTHLVLTAEGVNTYEQYTPATVDKQCVRTEDGHDCNTTYTPASTTTYEKPTAQFVVFRVPPEAWAQLAAQLQPQPASP